VYVCMYICMYVRMLSLYYMEILNKAAVLTV
jgi:hypothetical protein